MFTPTHCAQAYWSSSHDLAVKSWSDCRDLLPEGKAADLVAELVVRSINEVIAVSRAAARRLAHPRQSHPKITVIDNPVDTARFDPRHFVQSDAKSLLGVTGQAVLGLIAQITPWKGHDRAIRVLDLVRERTVPMPSWLSSERRSS